MCSKLHGIFNLDSILLYPDGPDISYNIPVAPNKKTKTKESIFIISKIIRRTSFIYICTPLFSHLNGLSLKAVYLTTMLTSLPLT